MSQMLKEHYLGRIKDRLEYLAKQDKEYENRKEIHRCQRALELIELGVNFKEVTCGFKLSNGLLIAARANKYSYSRNYNRWYSFKSLPLLIAAVGPDEIHD